MAGSGYRDWTAGDAPTAAQFDTFLQEQTVMVFASAAARDTALSTVKAEGMVCYLLDTKRYEAYIGTVWVRIGWTASIGRTGCTVSRIANQAISASTTTAISWDTENADTDGFIAVTSSTVTIPAGLGGLYSMTARVVWASAPTSGAAAFTFGGIVHSMPTANQIGNTSAYNLTLPLSAADTIQFSVRHEGGAPINATAAMWVYRFGL